MQRKVKKIIFVCTGNTCRSPMAEAILRALLKEKGILGVKVSSGGISPVVGQPIAQKANAALEFLGFKPVRHRARLFQSADAEAWDLVVCVTENHRKYLGGRDNITTVAAITGLHDVGDPYGDSVETYIKTAEYLKYACLDILSIIEKALAAEKKERLEQKALKKQAKPLKEPKPKALKPKPIKTPKPKAVKIKPEKTADKNGVKKIKETMNKYGVKKAKEKGSK